MIIHTQKSFNDHWVELTDSQSYKDSMNGFKSKIADARIEEIYQAETMMCLLSDILAATET